MSLEKKKNPVNPRIQRILIQTKNEIGITGFKDEQDFESDYYQKSSKSNNPANPDTDKKDEQDYDFRKEKKSSKSHNPENPDADKKDEQDYDCSKE